MQKHVLPELPELPIWPQVASSVFFLFFVSIICVVYFYVSKDKYKHLNQLPLEDD